MVSRQLWDREKQPLGEPKPGALLIPKSHLPLPQGPTPLPLLKNGKRKAGEWGVPCQAFWELMPQGWSLPRHPSVGRGPQLSWAREVAPQKKSYQGFEIWLSFTVTFSSLLSACVPPTSRHFLSPSSAASHTPVLFPLRERSSYSLCCPPRQLSICQCPLQMSPTL